MTPDLRSDLRTGLVVIAASLLTAVPVGVLWYVIAPIPRLVKRSDGVFLIGGGTEVAIAADGWFAVCSATAGLVVVLVVFARMRHARLGPLLGLVIGGLAGAILAWRLGVLLGPPGIRDSVKGLAVGTRFNGPLKLSARGVLFAWPLASTVAYFALAAGLEPEPKAGAAQDGHRFPVTVLRPGYDIAEVDAAFARLDAGTLPAAELPSLRFASSRWRQGYDGTSVEAAVAAQLGSVSSPGPADGSQRPSPG